MTGERERQRDDGTREGARNAADEVTATASTGVDRAADSFLEIESELAGDGLEPDELVSGRIVDVDRVPTTAVPGGYPIEIETAEALSLVLVIDEDSEQTASVYFEWGEDLTETRLGRLLSIHGISPDQFATLYGRSLVVRREEGVVVPYVPAEPPRGSSRGLVGVGVGLGMTLLVFALALFGAGGALASAPIVFTWLMLTTVCLSVGTYLDAWYLRTHTDWEQGPLFWAFLAAIPGVNVASSIAYLRSRRNATPIG